MRHAAKCNPFAAVLPKKMRCTDAAHYICEFEGGSFMQAYTQEVTQHNNQYHFILKNTGSSAISLDKITVLSGKMPFHADTPVTKPSHCGDSFRRTVSAVKFAGTMNDTKLCSGCTESRFLPVRNWF